MFKVYVNFCGRTGATRKLYSGTAYNTFSEALSEAAEALKLFENVYILGGELPAFITTGDGYQIEG